MIALRDRDNSRFFLRVMARGVWIMRAGITIDEQGEHKPAAETTRFLSEAQGFKTRRQAERMRVILKERYGVKTSVIEINGGRHYGA